MPTQEEIQNELNLATRNQKALLSLLKAHGLLKVAAHPEREFLKTLGEQFSLSTDPDTDGESFDQLWKIYKDLVKKNLKSDSFQRTMENKRARSYACLGEIARNREVTDLGHARVLRLPAQGRYVIFSDHHHLPRGHRHDYFRQFFHIPLYASALSYYAQEGYTLVENGDVEDLVIFDPNPADAKRRAKMSYSEYQAYRLETRREQLRRILADADYQELYGQIREEFHNHGRLVRLIGNHDLNLHRGDFINILRTAFPGLRAYDYLVLEGEKQGLQRNRPAAFIITHGHQFDLSSNPPVAPKLGETISECLSWAFHGSDRIWRWNDGPRGWVNNTPFRNVNVREHSMTAERYLPHYLQKHYDEYLEHPQQVLRELDELAIRYDDEDLRWLAEQAMGHGIGWEYFESFTVMGAIFNEVATGQEFVKFRHTDEIKLIDQIFDLPGDPHPTVVLGHTHEVRHKAIYKHNKPFLYYANCGSAGRFENCIWGIEIDNGKLQVVAWYNLSNSRTRKRVYRPEGDQLVPVG